MKQKLFIPICAAALMALAACGQQPASSSSVESSSESSSSVVSSESSSESSVESSSESVSSSSSESIDYSVAISNKEALSANMVVGAQAIDIKLSIAPAINVANEIKKGNLVISVSNTEAFYVSGTTISAKKVGTATLKVAYAGKEDTVTLTAVAMELSAVWGTPSIAPGYGVSYTISNNAAGNQLNSTFEIECSEGVKATLSAEEGTAVTVNVADDSALGTITVKATNKFDNTVSVAKTIKVVACEDLPEGTDSASVEINYTNCGLADKANGKNSIVSSFPLAPLTEDHFYKALKVEFSKECYNQTNYKEFAVAKNPGYVKNANKVGNIHTLNIVYYGNYNNLSVYSGTKEAGTKVAAVEAAMPEAYAGNSSAHSVSYLIDNEDFYIESDATHNMSLYALYVNIAEKVEIIEAERPDPVATTVAEALELGEALCPVGDYTTTYDSAHVRTFTGILENIGTSKTGRANLTDPVTGESIQIYGLAKASQEETALTFDGKTGEPIFTWAAPGDFDATDYGVANGKLVTILGLVDGRNGVAQICGVIKEVKDAETTYAASVTAGEHGTATLSKTEGLAYGEEVTVTCTPEDGYEVDSIKVTTAYGTINVTETGKFNATCVNSVAVTFKVGVVLDPATATGTYSCVSGETTAFTEGDEITSYFKKTEGDDVIKTAFAGAKANAGYSYTDSKTKETTDWTHLGFKFGTSSVAGTMTVNTAIEFNTVEVKWVGWKTSDTLKINDAEAVASSKAYSAEDPIQTNVFTVTSAKSFLFTLNYRGFIQSVKFYNVTAAAAE